MTVHEHEKGATALHTACGATYDLSADQLRTLPIERALTDYNATKCGRCFDDGRGY